MKDTIPFSASSQGFKASSGGKRSLDQTVRVRMPIGVYAGRTCFLGFAVPWLNYFYLF